MNHSMLLQKSMFHEGDTTYYAYSEGGEKGIIPGVITSVHRGRVIMTVLDNIEYSINDESKCSFFADRWDAEKWIADKFKED